MSKKNIKHLVFDLGGVIVDLDVAETLNQMSALFGMNTEEMTTSYLQEPFFKGYERGEIDDEQFRKALRELSGKEASDSAIDSAWNAMIGRIPMFRIEWLQALHKKYHVHLLSNTNHLHILDFHSKFKRDTGITTPHELFDQVFYSYEIGHRKPEAACYQYVLDAIGAAADEVMFYDDNKENIQAAISLGIEGVLVPVNQLSTELLPDAE